MNGSIYKIVNSVTGQIYVGKTSRPIEKRWKQHINEHKTSKRYLHSSMREYGIDNFVVSVIETCHLDLLDGRERFWIKKLDSLAPKNFNLTEGGEGGDTSKSPNYKEAMKNRRSMAGENNPMYGIGGMKDKKHSVETVMRQKETHRQMWENMTTEKRVERAYAVSGDKNGMYGKSPSNSIEIEFEQIKYKSLREARDATGHSERFLKKHGKIL